MLTKLRNLGNVVIIGFLGVLGLDRNDLLR